jgi:hypothetical protein
MLLLISCYSLLISKVELLSSFILFFKCALDFRHDILIPALTKKLCSIKTAATVIVNRIKLLMIYELLLLKIITIKKKTEFNNL